MHRKGLQLAWNNGTESSKKVYFFLHSFTLPPFAAFTAASGKFSITKYMLHISKKKKRGSRGFFILSQLQEAGFSAQTETKIDEIWHLLHGRENEHKLRADMTMFTTQDSKQLYILMLYVLINNLWYVTKEEEESETEELKTYLADKVINSPLVCKNSWLPVLVQLKIAVKFTQWSNKFIQHKFTHVQYERYSCTCY